jgi:hypothetical protein
MGLLPIQGESGSGPPSPVQETLKDKVRRWWYTRVQKDLSSAMIVLSLADFTPYADDLSDLIHWKHWHTALHLLGATGVYWRARQVTHDTRHDNRPGP